jgi:integrase
MPRAKTTRRRSRGEGGAYEYRLSNGETRWRVKGLVTLPDGTTRQVNKRGFKTKIATKDSLPGTAALPWLEAQRVAAAKGQWVEPSRVTLGAYGNRVIDGLRVRPQTRASYLKVWRNAIEPYPLAGLRLAQLTGSGITAHYRTLEKTGRRDHLAGEGLSPRSVRYTHAVLSRVLAQAVRDKVLLVNPADAATPPTASEARSPEMHPWTEQQLAAFLEWAAGSHMTPAYRSQPNSDRHALWHFLAYTGCRRGEALALRWRDVDLDAGAARIRRSAGIVRVHGEGAAIREGDTKSGKPRVVSLDDDAVTVLRAHFRTRGELALQLARPDALVFGDLEGGYSHPERVTRRFRRDVDRCRAELGEDAVPVIRLHDLRHTHATSLLEAGVPVHVVSKRLGHASPVITMTIYAHLMPGSDEQAAAAFGDRMRKARTA